MTTCRTLGLKCSGVFCFLCTVPAQDLDRCSTANGRKTFTCSSAALLRCFTYLTGRHLTSSGLGNYSS